jgi:hypothetical protein
MTVNNGDRRTDTSNRGRSRDAREATTGFDRVDSGSSGSLWKGMIDTMMRLEKALASHLETLKTELTS